MSALQSSTVLRNPAFRPATVAVVFFAINALLQVSLHSSWLIPLLALVIIISAVLAMVLLIVGLADRSRPPRRASVVWLFAMLAIISFHLSFGGNTNWFDLGMRWRVRQAGGLDAVRAWTRSVMNDPTIGMGQIEARQVPQQFRALVAGLRVIKEDGGSVCFIQSGWEAGRGLVFASANGPGRSRMGATHRVWADDVYLWTQP